MLHAKEVNIYPTKYKQQPDMLFERCYLTYV